ncbi:MAG: hypothetical protein KGH64_06160 [Candidatus Micrarchaeota archaeon]|nr:hypothetical protein [Candidatus Micrarchaeota archaeon]
MGLGLGLGLGLYIIVLAIGTSIWYLGLDEYDAKANEWWGRRWPLFTFGWPFGILVILLKAVKMAWDEARDIFKGEK